MVFMVPKSETLEPNVSPANAKESVSKIPKLYWKIAKNDFLSENNAYFLRAIFGILKRRFEINLGLRKTFGSKKIVFGSFPIKK